MMSLLPSMRSPLVSLLIQAGMNSQCSKQTYSLLLTVPHAEAPAQILPLLCGCHAIVTPLWPTIEVQRQCKRTLQAPVLVAIRAASPLHTISVVMPAKLSDKQKIGTVSRTVQR